MITVQNLQAISSYLRIPFGEVKLIRGDEHKISKSSNFYIQGDLLCVRFENNKADQKIFEHLFQALIISVNGNQVLCDFERMDIDRFLALLNKFVDPGIDEVIKNMQTENARRFFRCLDLPIVKAVNFNAEHLLEVQFPNGHYKKAFEEAFLFVKHAILSHDEELALFKGVSIDLHKKTRWCVENGVFRKDVAWESSLLQLKFNLAQPMLALELWESVLISPPNIMTIRFRKIVSNVCKIRMQSVINMKLDHDDAPRHLKNMQSQMLRVKNNVDEQMAIITELDAYLADYSKKYPPIKSGIHGHGPMYSLANNASHHTKTKQGIAENWDVIEPIFP